MNKKFEKKWRNEKGDMVLSRIIDPKARKIDKIQNTPKRKLKSGDDPDERRWVVGLTELVKNKDDPVIYTCVTANLTVAFD